MIIVIIHRDHLICFSPNLFLLIIILWLPPLPPCSGHVCCRELTSRPAQLSRQQHDHDEEDHDHVDDEDEDEAGRFNEDDEGLYHQHQTLCTTPSFVCCCARLSLRILGEHTDLAETKRKPVMSEP